MSELNKRITEMVSRAYTNSPAVLERFDKAGIHPSDIQSVADLSKIPVLAKDAIIEMQQNDPPFGGLLGVPMSEVRHIYLSPGPIYEPDAGEDRTALEMCKLCLEKTGFTAEDIVLNTLSYHLVPAGELLDSSLVALGATVVPGGVGNTDLQVKLMKDLNITGYVGTPSFLIRLIERAEEMGLDFKRDLKLTKAMVSTEPLFPALRQRLTEEYGLTLGNGYATADVGFLALNLDGGMAMGLLPRPIVQVVDPDTGQDVGPGDAGEVVVTNLNAAYPVIRLGTGDLAVNVDPDPGNSKQEQRAIILVGRSGEAVKVRGMFVHPNQVRFALTQSLPFTGFEGRISHFDNRDNFSLRVGRTGGGEINHDLEIDKIKAQIRAVCRVKVDEVEIVESNEIKPGLAVMIDDRAWI